VTTIIDLTIVDQGPASAETGPAATLRESVRLAMLAEDWGYRRYWFAEHHGVRNMAVAAPEILAAHVAAQTGTIRVGTGGMMLANHTPLHLAEQFRTLEALHPGRIDLGVGRSTGTGDDATRDAVRRAGASPADLDRLLSLVGARPASDDGAYATLSASPSDAPAPEVVLLGSSVSSAEAAARLGLPYAFFGVYQAPAAAVTALRRYRELFRPFRAGDQPHAILAARVWVGDDDAHAAALAWPERLAALDYLTGTPRALCSIEDAARRTLTEAQQAQHAALDYESDIVGGVVEVRAELRKLVAETGADELAAVSNIHNPADRRASFERLAIAASPQAW
jgi:luciferase family oxidoreductase group 1